MTEAQTEKLQDKLAAAKEEMQRLKKLETQMLEAPDKQVSLTDPDARSMKTRGAGVVGYNVQAAVDVMHHLIPAHGVTNSGSDRNQLAAMANKAREAMGRKTLDVVADAGYFNGKEIVACEADNVTPLVPKPQTSPSKAKGRYDKQDFVYLPEEDEYLCPAGQRLPHRFISEEKEMKLHVYFSSSCGSCELKAHCTTGKERRIKRWEHEGVLEFMQERLEKNPDAMLLRKQTVEHPFGTIKHW